ncbi:uncharacterized protein AMSG_12223 [Thecamonas trahens ATCC 50062]|uniref:Abnormal spindle-like microcephaly-associated protein ASH domain-containing protein n=1 Tax=Thecamonas trahens ATCC 50062 TaxID=461836 RepID=A0A0L0DKA9_THETB|nr:hypothetical protein AMSG_12223 [Thecamonas trahens ATCC 50062]KNC52844.1 hypothetical protein AMSG_12223 [Thecamonas trahens ATCC 50062]|eukprot:XP_013755009.1 hypothetical protein AMSG_12223 [Thecamonas trahens ATCC 50062]
MLHDSRRHAEFDAATADDAADDDDDGAAVTAASRLPRPVLPNIDAGRGGEQEAEGDAVAQQSQVMEFDSYSGDDRPLSAEAVLVTPAAVVRNGAGAHSPPHGRVDHHAGLGSVSPMSSDSLSSDSSPSVHAAESTRAMVYEWEQPPAPPPPPPNAEAQRAAVLDRYTAASGVITTYKTRDQREERIVQARAQRQLAELQTRVESCAVALQQARASLTAARREVDGTHAAMREVDKDIRKVTRSALRQPFELGSLRKRRAQLETQVRLQEREVTDAERAVARAEAELGTAERERTKVLPMEEALTKAGQSQLVELKVIANARLERELASAYQVDQRARTRELALVNATRKEATKVAVQMDSAVSARRKAAARIKAIRKAGANEDAAAAEATRAALTARRKAIRELKDHTEEAQAEIRAANKARARAAARRRREEEREAAAILARGGNPEEVFRRRRLEEAYRRRAEAEEVELEERKMAIAARVLVEEERHERQLRRADKLSVEQATKASAQRRILSRKDKREAVMEYLRSHKRDDAVLDGGLPAPQLGPNSIQPPFPSDIAPRESWAHPLGDEATAMTRELEAAERAKYAELVSSLPPLTASASTTTGRGELPKLEMSDGERGSGRATGGADPFAAFVRPISAPAERGGAARGRTSRQSRGSDDMLVPEMQGLWESDSKRAGNRAGEAVRSARMRRNGSLHRRARSARTSRPRIDPNYSDTVRVAGFEASPASLTFADFVVGEHYSQTFSLTNVSYGFNSFKVLELPLAVRDFFEVAFTPQGNMSAGLSTELTVTFSPKVDEDLTTLLQIQSKTGVLGVPIAAKTRKCDVALESKILDFGSVVIGESSTLKLTIINSGAVPTEFELDPYVLDRELPESPEVAPLALVPLSECVPVTADELVRASELALSRDDVPEFQRMDASSIEVPDVHFSFVVSCSDSDESASMPGRGGGGSGSSQTSVSTAVGLTAGSESPWAQAAAESQASSVGGEQGEAKARPDVPVFGLDAFEGRVPGYGLTSVGVTFSPSEVGVFELHWLITFDSSEKRLGVVVRGVAEPIPISVGSTGLDLGVCYAGHIYRDIAVLHNDSTSTCKISLAVPPLYAGCVEFLPQVGFVQAQSSLSVQVKFAPSEELLAKVGRLRASVPQRSELAQGHGAMVNMPIKISVKGQALPVFFHLYAALTSPSLVVHPTTLSFGRVSLHASRELELRVSNPSLLVQQYGFLTLDAGWSIEPQDGFGSLLPGESRVLRVQFAPTAAVSYTTKLVCKSSLGQELVVSASGSGFKPALVFGAPSLALPATPIGSCSSARVYLRNPSKVAHKFELAWAPELPIVVEPSVGEVPGRGEILLLVLLAPGEQTADLLPAPRGAAASADVPAAKNASEGGNGGGGGEVVRRELSEEEAALALLEQTLQKVAAGGQPRRSGTRAIWAEAGVRRSPVVCFVAGAPKSEAVLLDLVLPVVEPALAVISNGGSRVLDFGEVPMGERVVKTLTLRNESDEVVEPAAGPLDPVESSFVVLSGMRAVAPGKSLRLLLEFAPSSQGRYNQELELYKREELRELGTSATAVLSVALVGLGSSPSLLIEPLPRALFMGDVKPGESVSERFTLTNSSSSFDVSFVASLRRSGELNRSGINPFSVSVPRGRLLPGERLELVVEFAPDHASERYADELLIELPSEHDNVRIPLSGVAHARDVFLLAVGSVPTPLVQDLGAPLVFAGMEDESEPRHEIVVQVELLAAADGRSSEGKLRFGNVARGAPAELILEPLSADAVAAGFEIPGARTVVQPRSEEMLVIRYTGPPRRADETTIHGHMGLLAKDGKRVSVVVVAKWKKDPEAAAIAYTAAGVAYKAAKAHEDVVRVCEKAAARHEETGAIFHAGQAKERAAEAALALNQHSVATRLYSEAAIMYRMNGSLPEALKVYNVAAKALEGKDKFGEALDLLTIAEELFADGEMDLRFASETYRTALRIAIKKRDWARSLELLEAQIGHFTALEQDGMLFKTMLSYVVVALASNDYVAADRANTAHLSVRGYLRSTESNAANDLLDAFESADDDAIAAVASRQVFTFLDQGVLRLARALTSGGVRSGGKKKSSKTKARSKAAAAPAASSPDAPDAAQAARNALFAAPSTAAAAADASTTAPHAVLPVGEDEPSPAADVGASEPAHVVDVGASEPAHVDVLGEAQDDDADDDDEDSDDSLL